MVYEFHRLVPTTGISVVEVLVVSSGHACDLSEPLESLCSAWLLMLFRDLRIYHFALLLAIEKEFKCQI